MARWLFLCVLVLSGGCRAKTPPPVPENPEACDLSLFEPAASGGCNWSRLRAATGEQTLVTALTSSCGILSVAWGPDHRHALLAAMLPTPIPSPTPAKASRVSPAMPSPTPEYSVELVDFTTGERLGLGDPPDGRIVSFGWDSERRPAVVSQVPLNAEPQIWSKVRSISGAKRLPDCDPGGVYLFAKTAQGEWSLTRSVLGDCETFVGAHPEQLSTGLSGLITGYRTPYRNANAVERRAIGLTGGGIVFESAYGDVIAAGTDGAIRTPLAFVTGAEPFAVDLPDRLELSGGVRNRCLLLTDRTGARPRLYDLKEKRLRFKSDSAVGVSFWPVAEPSPTATPR